MNVEIQPDGFITGSVDSKVVVSPDANDLAPAITRSGGASGRHVVAWQRRVFDIFTLHETIHARVLGEDLTLPSPEVDVYTGGLPGYPDVAGDGEGFLVAFDDSVSILAPTGRVLAKSARIEGNTLVVDPAIVTVVDDPATDHREAAVCRVPGRYLVAYSEKSPAVAQARDVYVQGICASTDRVVGDRIQLATDAAMIEVAIASSFGGGAAAHDDGAMAAWQNDPSSLVSSQSVGARVLEAYAAGAVTNLGGGCGSSGTIGTSGKPSIGFPSFGVTLGGADPIASAALLNLGVPGVPTIPCGTCEVMPFDWLIAAPVEGGAAEVRFGVPCKPSLAGKSMEAQWMVGLTSASPCSLIPQVSFTSRIAVLFAE